MANTRGKAYGILKNIFENRAYSDIALDAALSRSTLDGRDRAFVTNIVYGVLTNLSFLDYQIGRYSNIPLRKISDKVKIVLRLSLYQIVFMDKVPDSAAVNEGVNLAKKATYKSAGFVNAVLHAFLRGGAVLPPEKDKVKYLSVKYSCPEWLVKMWLGEFPEEECEKLLAEGNKTPPVTVRVNTLKISKDELKKLIPCTDGAAENALNITGRGNIAENEYFKKGYFAVQDAAAQLAVEALGIKENDNVLDMCAAPGGKTTYISRFLKGGSVTAWDIYPHKIRLIETAAKRLGCENINAYVHDAAEPSEELYGKFDRVLLDAPCSGLGIIRKKPDIKWLRKKEDIVTLANEQKKLILAAANYVKEGGTLVYSTCTVSRAENEEVTAFFLKERKDFELACEPRLLLPQKDGTDGFYICAMTRKKDEHF